jgi:integrase
MRKWRRYAIGPYSLGQLNGEAVVVWREGGKRRRFRLGVFSEQQGRAALDGWARQQAVLAGRTARTVAELWELYIADRRADGKVTANMAYHWRALGPRFGRLSPDDVTADVCRDYAETRRQAGKSQGTVWTELTQLRTALNWAVKRKHLEKPTFYVWVPLKPKPAKQPLSEAEALRLIDACGMPHVRLFVVLALTTAGRTRALLELTWDRVHFDTGIIDLRVPQLVDWLAKRVQKGRAAVYMNEFLRRELMTAKAGALTGHVIEWDGAPVGCIRKGFMAAVARAGLRHVTPHLLRHTAASWMEEAGVPMSQISRFLGHDDETTTRKIYAKPRAAHLAAAADVLDLSRAREQRSQVRKNQG